MFTHFLSIFCTNNIVVPKNIIFHKVALVYIVHGIIDIPVWIDAVGNMPLIGDVAR